MKKPTRSSISNKLDKICSEITRSRGRCDKCGMAQYEKLQCAHIFSRKFRSVRWYLDNLLCLCQSCHFWGHANPILFTEFVKSFLGDYRYEQLKAVATPTKKWLLCEMVDLYRSLQKISGD